MLFSVLPEISKRVDADLLVLPFWEGEKKVKGAAAFDKKWQPHLKHSLDSEDFKAKEGEILLLYGDFGKEKRVALLGLGREEKLSIDSLRRSFAAIIRLAQKKKYGKLNLVLPNIVELRNLSVEEFLQGVSEGILLSNYQFEQKSKSEVQLVQKVTLIGLLPKMLPLLERAVKVFDGVYFARDLINGNADSVTPSYLAQMARQLQERLPSLKATIFDKKRLEKEKMGLLLAVGRGSPHEPAFIILEYKGNPRSKEHSVIVGKGVTFDTGGLNLKPTGSMETMRDDMSGAAAVLGTMANIASLGLKVNVTALIPTCENAMDGYSYKPGDVYKSYSGKTVEIGNTDAEGRLILADAISYAVKNLQPSRIINLATLTGAAVVALGHDFAATFSNEDKLFNELFVSSERSQEKLWRMPLHLPYKEHLKSDIADLKNSGGRAGGAILGALFLEEFVEKVPWVHIDIAGAAFLPKEGSYLPKNGTGFGVRLLTDFFSRKAI